MKYSIITIGREYGSGGRIIAKQVAETLGIAFYDKELIHLAAQKTGLSEEYISSSATHHKANKFFYNLIFSSDNLPVSDQLYIAETDIIKKVSDDGPCVIVGRCADYILRERQDCLKIFIHAPLEERIARAKNDYGISEDIENFVQKTDKERSAHYDYFTNQEWGKAQNYHMTINSTVGLDMAVKLIIAAATGGEVNK